MGISCGTARRTRRRRRTRSANSGRGAAMSRCTRRSIRSWRGSTRTGGSSTACAGQGATSTSTPVVARCFFCGAIHTQVVLPADRTALEAVLLRRPRAANRHWQPGETVAALEAENTAHGCD